MLIFFLGNQRPASPSPGCPSRDYFCPRDGRQGLGALLPSRTVAWPVVLAASLPPPLLSPSYHPAYVVAGGDFSPSSSAFSNSSSPLPSFPSLLLLYEAAMDALCVIPLLLLLLPLLLLGSSTFVFYFKKCFYVGYMMVLALAAIPMCVLKSGGRDVENMRIIRVLVRHVKYYLGLRFDVSGWEHLQTEGPYVIISNHQSSLDVLGLMEILPDRCTMIAKKELIYAGTVGLICWLGGIVFINRKKTSDAKSVMADAAQTMLDERIRLWVFPEGTRNQTGDLLPFKKGAFHLAVQAQVPIIPIVFSSYRSFYLRKEKQFNSGTIRVNILPKIDTKGMTLDDVSSLCDKSYNVMREVFLNVPDSKPQSNGPSRR